MKIDTLKSTSINLLKKFLDEHPDEVFTVGELKEYGFTFKSDDLASAIGDDYNYKTRKYRVFGCKKVIKWVREQNI